MECTAHAMYQLQQAPAPAIALNNLLYLYDKDGVSVCVDSMYWCQPVGLLASYPLSRASLSPLFFVSSLTEGLFALLVAASRLRSLSLSIFSYSLSI
jgi:hypothetical protein